MSSSVSFPTTLPSSGKKLQAIWYPPSKITPTYKTAFAPLVHYQAHEKSPHQILTLEGVMHQAQILDPEDKTQWAPHGEAILRKASNLKRKDLLTLGNVFRGAGTWREYKTLFLSKSKACKKNLLATFGPLLRHHQDWCLRTFDDKLDDILDMALLTPTMLQFFLRHDIPFPFGLMLTFDTPPYLLEIEYREEQVTEKYANYLADLPLPKLDSLSTPCPPKAEETDEWEKKNTDILKQLIESKSMQPTKE